MQICLTFKINQTGIELGYEYVIASEMQRNQQTWNDELWIYDIYDTMETSVT